MARYSELLHFWPDMCIFDVATKFDCALRGEI